MLSRDARLKELGEEAKRVINEHRYARQAVVWALGGDPDEDDRDLSEIVQEALREARRESAPDPVPRVRAALIALSAIEKQAKNVRERLENGHA